MDLGRCDLTRLRKSEAQTIARWLADPDALTEFKIAIHRQLFKFGRPRPENAETVYLLGREMRRIYDLRANKDLILTFETSRLDADLYRVFATGFARRPYNEVGQYLQTDRRSHAIS